MPDVVITSATGGGVAGAAAGGPPGAVLGTIGGAALGMGYNAWQAAMNRKFQRNMANTSHQREVKDLRAAGLNPILSARLGGSASPPGNAAHAAGPDVGATMNQSSAQGIQRQLALGQIDLMDAQSRQATSAASLAGQQADTVMEMRKHLVDQASNDAASSAYGLEAARRSADFHKGPGGAIKPWLDAITPLVPKGGYQLRAPGQRLPY